jgi:hypothetical protein
VYSADKIVAASPMTFFVHSKSVFLSAAENHLRQVFGKIVARSPDADKLLALKLYTGFRTGEYDSLEMESILCRSSNGKDKNVQACKNVVKVAAQRLWAERFPQKTYIWTADFHGGPINCNIPIITEAGGVVHAEIDFGNCAFYGLCKDRLKVLSFNNWGGFDPSKKTKKMFAAAYRNDAEFKRIDAFICSHPVANCELFLEFNKPIIVHATTRLEFGRDDAGIDWRLPRYDTSVAKQKWREWVETLIGLSRNKRNIIAANNHYDVEYIKYFTGIDAVYLPSWCGDCDGAYRNVNVNEPRNWGSSLPPMYAPTREEVLIVPYRNNLDRSRWKSNLRKPNDHPIYRKLLQASHQANGAIVRFIADVYEDSNPIRTVDHPAVVVIPYQVSTMYLFEVYRMSVPIFAPSLALLKKWCWKYDIMWEKTYGWPERHGDVIGKQSTLVPDPNGRSPMNVKTNRTEWGKRFDYWMPLADLYKWKHIQYFDTWEEFFRKLTAADLFAISNRMEVENRRVRKDLVQQWTDVLEKVQLFRSPSRHLEAQF